MKFFFGLALFIFVVVFAITYEPSTEAKPGEPSHDVVIIQSGQQVYHAVSAGRVITFGYRIKFTDKATGKPVRISRGDLDTVIISEATHKD